MSNDDEDFVFYGTPIEREEELATRKKKAVAEASGQLRTTLPAWKQEVRDEEGRRRFHGAFTGGFSAGYYNTVGSKEGWTPQAFSSSRKSRAEVKQQSIFNFLDEDERAELEGQSLGTSMQFDTFGFTAVELARKQAEKEQQQRPSTIPGPVPDELIAPVTESIGVKLLSKMGWRQGRSIKDSNRSSLYDARREARKAFLAFSDNVDSQLADSKIDEEDIGNDAALPTDSDQQFARSTPAYVLNPKQDLYGLGYDPFKQAPEFREKKRQRKSGDKGMEHYRSLSIKGKVGPGFGIGALEELDAEDEDIYASGYEFQDNFVQEIEEPSRVNVDNLRILDKKRQDVLPGFKAASTSDSTVERFDPPAIPKDFVPHHKCSSIELDGQNAEIPPPEVLPPEDTNLKVLIEGVATLVARCGKLFEDLSREKNQSNPLFAFLNGGNGSDFYARKLWEERQKRGEQPKLLDEKKPQKSEQLTAESRGKILGEKALERSSRDSDSLVASAASVNLQFKLSDTFTKPVSANEQPDPTKPFHEDPAKQKRFEQFLKEKYEGGLRTKDSGGSSNMSESDRARERLEFEAAAEAIQKGSSGKETRATSQLLADLSATSGLQFTTSGSGLEKDKVQQNEELVAKAVYPKREEFQWRPAPILCKRFNLVDPYMGKPPPPPRARSKMESLMFLPDFIQTANGEEHITKEQGSSEVPQLHKGKQTRETTDREVEDEVEVENIERPVDLYKAIFSDDSEDEQENTAATNQVENTHKKFEAANTALNRLMAGDFLESLGKELGLAVPPEMPPSENKVGVRVAGKQTDSMDKGNATSLPAEKNRSSALDVVSTSMNEETTENIPEDEQKARNKSTSPGEGGKTADVGLVGGGSDENRTLKVPSEKNLNTHRGQKQSRSSSSEDERSRKRSRSRRHRSGSSDSSYTSGDSDDHRDHHRSRYKRKDKGTHREKGGKRRHSKYRHRKHSRKDSSPSRSHHSSEKHENRRLKKNKYEK